MRILFITASDIFDEFGNGGSKGSRKNYDLLVSCVGKENVYIILFDLPQYARDLSVEKQLLTIPQPQNNREALFASIFGCKKYMPGAEKKVYEYVKKINPDVIFYDGSVIGKLIKKNADYKQIVFLHNVEVDYSWNKVIKEGFRFLPAYFATRRNEEKIKYADKVGCLNSRDSNIIKRLYGVDADFYLPVSFKDQFDEKRVRKPLKNRILFVGSFFGPNIDGIEWFIENVMPEIPDIQLDIVGKGFENKKAEYEKHKNVNVIGSVKDISEYYYSHSTVVMPILYGAGMKVKTAEAMMYGRTIVATDEALEGYDVEGVEGIYRCNSAEEFIERINKSVLSLEKFNKCSRKLFLNKYENISILSKVSNALGIKDCDKADCFR